MKWKMSTVAERLLLKGEVTRNATSSELEAWTPRNSQGPRDEGQLERRHHGTARDGDPSQTPRHSVG